MLIYLNDINLQVCSLWLLHLLSPHVPIILGIQQFKIFSNMIFTDKIHLYIVESRTGARRPTCIHVHTVKPGNWTENNTATEYV